MSFASTATEEQRKAHLSEFYHEKLPLTCTLLVCDAANNIICGKLSFPFDQLTSMNVIKLKELVRSSSWLATRIRNNSKSKNNSRNNANGENVRLAYYVINIAYNIQESNATFLSDEIKKQHDNYSNYLSTESEINEEEKYEEEYNNRKEIKEEDEIEQSDTLFDNEINQNAIVNNAKHSNKSVIVNFPLKPLESNIEDWHELCQDVIIHGCKSIRLVVAYSTEQQQQEQQQQKRAVNERERSEIRKVENINASSDNIHFNINKNDNNKETVNQQEPIRRSLLMVKCNINPTEIHITGSVESNTLEALRRAIFTKCYVCHSYLQAIQGIISETTDKYTSDETNEVNDITLWEYLPAFEQVDHKRSKRSEDTERSYVIKLHCFHFTKADEEVLQKCVNEVLTRCEECTPVRV